MNRLKTQTWGKLTGLGLFCVFPALVAAQQSAALLSCHGVDFEPGADIPFIIFSSHGYPAVTAKMEQDFGTERLTDLLALGKFSGLAVNDMFVPLLTLPCSYDTYEATGCGPNFLFGGGVENASLTGERLSFTLIDEDVVNEVVIGNRNYDSLTLTSTKGAAVTTSAWSRLGDGTEIYSGDSGDGNVIRYTERPDCSGEGYIAQAENGSVKQTFEVNWTSTTAADFTLSYTLCNYVDGTDCVSGAF